MAMTYGHAPRNRAGQHGNSEHKASAERAEIVEWSMQMAVGEQGSSVKHDHAEWAERACGCSEQSMQITFAERARHRDGHLHSRAGMGKSCCCWFAAAGRLLLPASAATAAAATAAAGCF